MTRREWFLLATLLQIAAVVIANQGGTAAAFVSCTLAYWAGGIAWKALP